MSNKSMRGPSHVEFENHYYSSERIASLESAVRDLNVFRTIAISIVGETLDGQRGVGQYYRRYRDSDDTPETRQLVQALLRL